MNEVTQEFAKALAIEISKDADYEDVYQAAIENWSEKIMNRNLNDLREEYEERYDYLFSQVIFNLSFNS